MRAIFWTQVFREPTCGPRTTVLTCLQHLQFVSTLSLQVSSCPQVWSLPVTIQLSVIFLSRNSFIFSQLPVSPQYFSFQVHGLAYYFCFSQLRFLLASLPISPHQTDQIFSKHPGAKRKALEAIKYMVRSPGFGLRITRIEILALPPSNLTLYKVFNPSTPQFPHP